MVASVGRSRADHVRWVRRQRLTDIQVHQGIGAMLASLFPKLSWDSKEQVLRFGPQPLRPSHLWLEGRGLVIVPSMFTRRLVIRFDSARPDTPVVLFQPAMPAGGLGPGRSAGEALADLLGRTRANVLTALAGGALTTSELAGRADISVSSASEHASVLRNSGLVGSNRSGNTVRHKLTKLGVALLERNF